MGFIKKLKKTFAKRIDKVENKICNFLSPVKPIYHYLFEMFKKVLCFVQGENFSESPFLKGGLRGKFDKEKQKLKGLSDLQKLILLTIAVVFPAGIIVAFSLAKLFHKIKGK